MNKTIAKNVIAVVMGIALIIEIFQCFSMIFNGAFMDDVLLFKSSEKHSDIIGFIKWSAVGVGCLLIPALLGCVFAYFSKSRLLKIFAAAIWFCVVVSGLSLLFVLRKTAIGLLDAECYLVAAEFINALLTMAIPAILLCVYFVVDGIKAEVKSNEEV